MSVLAESNSSSILQQPEPNEMTALGITRLQIDYFHYKEFRYTELADAIAEAKRDERRRRRVSARDSDVGAATGRSRGCIYQEGTVTPEKRTVRHVLLNAWRDARRANLSFPLRQEPTLEHMDEQLLLEREQEKARVKLAEFDAVRAPRETPPANVSSADKTGTGGDS